MSKRTIYKEDLGTFGRLQDFFELAVLTPSQKETLGTVMESSIFWDNEEKPWNKAFVRGITAAQGRIHDMLGQARGSMAKFHSSGLTKEELEEIAGYLGIPKTKTGKTKEAIWTQIKRKISPDISKEELRWVFAGLAGAMTDDDVAWLKNNVSRWGDYDSKNEDWMKNKTATITDLEVLIEDIIGMTVNRVVANHHPKLTKADLMAVEKKLGIKPPSSQLVSRAVIKLRIIKYIRDDIKGLFRRAGVAIPQNLE